MGVPGVLGASSTDELSSASMFGMGRQKFLSTVW